MKQCVGYMGIYYSASKVQSMDEQRAGTTFQEHEARITLLAHTLLWDQRGVEMINAS